MERTSWTTNSHASGAERPCSWTSCPEATRPCGWRRSRSLTGDSTPATPATPGGRQESSVKLEVEAAVTKVSIAEEGERITCRSEGIFPSPRVTWSGGRSPDTSIEQPAGQELYSVRSSVLRSGHQEDFTCKVTTPGSSRSRHADHRRPHSDGEPGDLPLLCSEASTHVHHLELQTAAWWSAERSATSATSRSAGGTT
ncbi:uncharacterized protein ACB058_021703 isoform 1-T1 [Synchiropus picturatus]